MLGTNYAHKKTKGTGFTNDLFSLAIATAQDRFQSNATTFPGLASVAEDSRGKCAIFAHRDSTISPSADPAIAMPGGHRLRSVERTGDATVTTLELVYAK